MPANKYPIISFRVDPDIYLKVEKMAAINGQSPGGFSRAMLLEGLAEQNREDLETKLLLEEVQLLKRQISRGVELLARLICREDPNERSQAEELIASWVQREIPR